MTTDPATRPTVTLAVLITVGTMIVSGISGGSWYMATQSASNSGLQARQAQFEASTVNRLDALDKRFAELTSAIQVAGEARNVTTGLLADRLTRMEAQMNYLVVSNAPAGGKR